MPCISFKNNYIYPIIVIFIALLHYILHYNKMYLKINVRSSIHDLFITHLRLMILNSSVQNIMVLKIYKIINILINDIVSRSKSFKLLLNNRYGYNGILFITFYLFYNDSLFG